MILGESAGAVGTESGGGIVAVEQGVVDSGDEAVEGAFADARLWGVDVGSVAEVVLFQRLVGEVVGADGTVGRGACLFGVASQGVNLMDAEFFVV